MSKYQLPLEKTPTRTTPVSSQSPVTGMASDNPWPKSGYNVSVAAPSHIPLPLVSMYQTPLKKIATPSVLVPVSTTIILTDALLGFETLPTASFAHA